MNEHLVVLNTTKATTCSVQSIKAINHTDLSMFFSLLINDVIINNSIFLCLLHREVTEKLENIYSFRLKISSTYNGHKVHFQTFQYFQILQPTVKAL